MKVPLLVLAVVSCCPAMDTTAQTAPLAAARTVNGSAVPEGTPAQRAAGPCSTKTKLRPGFLIIGTVFNEQALSFPGTTVRIRCAGEKTYRWVAVTNSRGEFAVRVPEGRSYEVLVRAKNYIEQNAQVRTDQGDIQQRLAIRLQPIKPRTAGGSQ